MLTSFKDVVIQNVHSDVAGSFMMCRRDLKLMVLAARLTSWILRIFQVQKLLREVTSSELNDGWDLLTIIRSCPRRLHVYPPLPHPDQMASKPTESWLFVDSFLDPKGSGTCASRGDFIVRTAKNRNQ